MVAVYKTLRSRLSPSFLISRSAPTQTQAVTVHYHSSLTTLQTGSKGDDTKYSDFPFFRSSPSHLRPSLHVFLVQKRPRGRVQPTELPHHLQWPSQRQRHSIGVCERNGQPLLHYSYGHSSSPAPSYRGGTRAKSPW
jgi:hypothetical protein